MKRSKNNTECGECGIEKSVSRLGASDRGWIEEGGSGAKDTLAKGAQTIRSQFPSLPLSFSLLIIRDPSASTNRDTVKVNFKTLQLHPTRSFTSQALAAFCSHRTFVCHLAVSRIVPTSILRTQHTDANCDPFHLRGSSSRCCHYRSSTRRKTNLCS